jgi:TctA family transporter
VHDAVVVEYSGLTAALAVLVSSISGVFVSALPSTSARAAALVAAAARSNHVSAPAARAAYARARYRKPALGYLYAVGWVDAASHASSCKAALLLGPDPRTGAAQAIRAQPKFVARLRAAHIGVNQAAAAIGRGITEGCGEH